ncbi:MAG: glycoside hydrolase family 16 protein, partial [Bacteroidota bacterium]|nr:glycoside hydrolase family 16 protein [Bacteroidota bacterium]
KIIGLFAMLCISLIAFAQQPYKINPVNGLPLLDGSNNPLRDDLNYKLIPPLSNEFIDEISTKIDFNYWTNMEPIALAYNVQEVSSEDNCAPHPSQHRPQGCNLCNNFNFFGTTLPYPIAHIYQSNPSLSTVKLITEKYDPDYIPGWCKRECHGTQWHKEDKKFTYTTGILNSHNAFKYGYFEARFKVDRGPDVTSTGLGHSFWMFPDKNPANIPNYVGQYCYSEINIAENSPDLGLHGFGAHVSQFDGGSCESNLYPDGSHKRFVTGECVCTECANSTSSIFHRQVEQDAFHTYALEWTPKGLKFFYDNVFITTVNNIGPNGKTPENLDPMRIIFDIEGGKDLLDFQMRCEEIDNNTVFPFEFEIDYVRQYKLDLSECNLVLPILNTQNTFNSFAANPKVRKEIYVGDANCNGCMVIVGNGINVSLRASDLIELNDGFEVDANGEFFADVIGGCDEGY